MVIRWRSEGSAASVAEGPAFCSGIHQHPKPPETLGRFRHMPISVVMPALEMAQETGKLIAWLKKEGQAVSKGEPLLEVETDKAVMEIESPGDGVLAGISVQAGAEVPVGRTIAWIVRPGESP